MTPEAEFRDAVARLHRAKDAAYRDAWKRRGEVISILANVARKVDRLEYGLRGAPTVPDESWVDTAVDLSRFGELEACFRGTASRGPVPARLGRLLALTDAAAALVGALRREHPLVYAGFIESCRAIGEGGADDAR